MRRSPINRKNELVTNEIANLYGFTSSMLN